MQTSNPIRVCVGVPSYKGPHVDVFDRHNAFHHYLGRLQERSGIRARYPDLDLTELASLDFSGGLDPEADIRPGEPEFRFTMAVMKKNSIIGQARDLTIKAAQSIEADFLLFYDDDMDFLDSVFLKLWRHRKPVVGSLAFTAREPIAPVLYRFIRKWDFAKMRERVDIRPIFDYPINKLFRVDAIGTGVVLFDMKVFKELKEPWFYGSIGSGEDVHLCWKLGHKGIPVYCDTSCKTRHVPNEHWRWMDEPYFLANLEKSKEMYEAIHAHDSDPDLS